MTTEAYIEPLRLGDLIRPPWLKFWLVGLAKDLANGLEDTFRAFFLLLALPFIIVLWPVRHIWLAKMTPNIMSLVRLVASPFVVLLGLLPALISQNQTQIHYWTLWVIALALLDGVDGPVARQLDATTDLGKVLDPAADKVLLICLLVTYLLSACVLTGMLMFAPLFVAIWWVLHVELKLIEISTKQIAPIVTSTGLEHPGANIWGKLKFNLQMIAMLTGFLFLIYAPAEQAGPLIAVVLLGAACWLADKSLHGHRRELGWMLLLTNLCPHEPAIEQDASFWVHLALATRYPLELATRR